MPGRTLFRLKQLQRVPYVFGQMRMFWRGFARWRYAIGWGRTVDGLRAEERNAFRSFFNARSEGAGIFKWDHYFDIYERHFSKFKGKPVNILEVGVYSGGSLEMWRDYFGSASRIYGVDIQPACAAYESSSVKVFIGDQSDRRFWRDFKQQVDSLDIVIDDGSHLPEHQIVTFEELLPHLRPGGIYLCEDISGVLNSFASYLFGFAHNLNASNESQLNLDKERAEVTRATALQSAVGSVHIYPYAAVVERRSATVREFVSLRHGSRWEPFLK